MASYHLNLTTSSQKELDRLSGSITRRVVERIGRLAVDPRPHGCKKLKGGVNEWRIRIGDYRVIYTIDDTAKIIDVTRIPHRSEVYEP